MPTTRDEAWTAAAIERYEGRLAAIGQRLRDLALRVEQEGRARPNITHPGDARPDYLNAAQRVVHEVMWGMANLSMDTLLSNAVDVHEARDAAS